VHDLYVDSPFSSSDHSMVKFKIINNIPAFNIESTSFDFNRANWVGIFEFLNHVDFIEALDGHVDIASKMDCFYSILNDCITANVPFVISKKKIVHLFILSTFVDGYIRRLQHGERIATFVQIVLSLNISKLLLNAGYSSITMHYVVKIKLSTQIISHHFIDTVIASSIAGL